MRDMISRDAVAKAVATLSQEFLDGGSPTAVKVLNLAMDRISAIPAADARAEALKEAARVAGDAAVAILLRNEPDASPLKQQLARQAVAVPILALIGGAK